jgi:hypothetical protein
LLARRCKFCESAFLRATDAGAHNVVRELMGFGAVFAFTCNSHLVSDTVRTPRSGASELDSAAEDELGRLLSQLSLAKIAEKKPHDI